MFCLTMSGPLLMLDSSGGGAAPRSWAMRETRPTAAPEPPTWWGRPVAETRSMLELARLLVDPVFLVQSGVERGDGRPVVLLPGFLAGDQTLAVMAGWL